MRFLHLDIHGFGVYQEFKLALGQPLHFLYAPNEAGKSTLAAFIYASLYGFPRRSKFLERDLRERYRPWGGQSYGGDLRLALGGRDLLIHREFQASSGADTVRIIDLQTGQTDLPETSDALGRELLDLSAEDYLAAAIVSDRLASESAFSHWQSLYARQQFSKQTSAYWEGIKRDLQDERRMLMAYRGNGGEIYELESRREACREAYYRALELEKKQVELRRQRDAMRAERESLESQSQYDQLSSELRALQDLRKRGEIWTALIAEQERATTTAGHRQVEREGSQTVTLPNAVHLSLKQMDELSFHASLFQEAEASLQKSHERVTSLQQAREAKEKGMHELSRQVEVLRQEELRAPREPEERRHSKRVSGGYLIAPLGLACLSLLVAVLVQSLRWPAVGLGLLALGVALWSYLSQHRALSQERRPQERWERPSRSQKAQELGWRLQQMDDDLQQILEQREDAEIERGEAERHFRRVRSDYLHFLSSVIGRKPEPSELSQIYHDVLKASINSEQRARQTLEWEGRKQRILSGLSEAEFLRELKRAEIREAEVQKELEALPRASQASLALSQKTLEELWTREAELSRELELSLARSETSADLARDLQELERRILDLHERVAVLDLAIDIGEASEERLKRQGHVALLDLASEFLADLTADRFSALNSSADLELELELATEHLHRHEAYFSSGTRDLVHLSMALAYARLIGEQREALPLILDDPALRLDSERKRRLLDLLGREARDHGRQIIYLSSDLELLNLARKGGFFCQKLAD